MSKGFEGGAISVLPDLSKEAQLVNGREILDLRSLRRQPHEVAAAVVGFVIQGTLPEGDTHNNSGGYRVRFEGPGRVSISPPPTPAAKEALHKYFGVEVVDVRPALSVVG